MIGPAQLRLRLQRAEFPDEYAREAEVWLLEKDAETSAVELERFKIIRRWTIAVGVGGVIAAIASLIAAWPVIKEWIK